jgi:hypothetical protein
MSDTSSRTHPGSVQLKFWHLLLIAAVTAGTWARLTDLGLWPLTTDEYFLGRSIGFIVEQGVPRFPCGGYYTRGLLQQYLTAPFLAWSTDPEWALRIVPVLANLLGLPAVYLIGRRLFGGTALACAATILYSLSIWEVELARFARMYAPFQAVFLWQIYFLMRAMDGGRRARSAVRMMLLLAALGLILYEGGIFLVLIAALPVLTGYRLKSLGHLLSVAVLGAAALALQLIDFRRMGTAPLLPEVSRAMAEAGPSTSLGPLALPVLEFSSLLQAPLWLTAYLLPALLTAAALWQLLRARHLSPGERSIWAGVLFLAALHLFLLAALLWLLWKFWGPEGTGRRSPPLLTAALLVHPVFWTLFLLAAGDVGHWREVAAFLLAYPEVFSRVVYPLAVAMPITTGLLLFLVSMLILLVSRQPARYAAEKNLLGATLVVLFFLGILETSYIEGRYSFFIYPLLLLLAVDMLCRLAALLSSPRLGTALLAGMLGGFMLVAEDFSYGHLRAIGTAEVNFRTRYDEGRKALYMHRRDFASPAIYVNEHRQAGERVISAVRVSDFYLGQTDLVYIDHHRRSFANYLACGGSRELWSHAPLLYRLEDLRRIIASSPEPLWVIVYADEWGGEERRMLQREHAEHQIYRNIDGTIDVYRIPSAAETVLSSSTN